MVINQEKISTHKTPTLPNFYQKPKQITIITTSYLQRNITKEHNILSESIVFDIKTYICIKTPTLPNFYQKPKQITIITTSYLQRNITKEHNILSESIVFDIKTYICIKTAFFNCCVTTAQFQRHQKFPLITIYFWQMAPHS